MSMLNKRKLLGDTILYSLGEIIPRILSFLLLPILTRFLSPADYGISSYTNTVMTFLFVFAALSLNTFLLRNYYLEKEEDRKRLIGSIFCFICIFNLVLLGLQMVFFPIIIHAFNINVPFKPFFALAIINNFFDVISIIPLVVYRIKENAKGFVLLSLSRIVLQFGLTYLMVVVFQQGLLGSYLAKLYINIPFALIYFFVIYRNATFSFDVGKIKQALKFSIPFLPASLSYLIISTSDRLILERYISLDALGIYSVAFTLSLALNIVTQALYRTFEQVIFKNYLHADFPSMNLILFKVFSIAVTVFGFSLALLSPEIFKIAASSNFYSGHQIVPFMVVSVVLAAYNVYLNTLLVAAEKQKITSLLNMISAGISVTLNLLLVPSFGFYGSIVSSICAVAFVTLGSYYFLRTINYRLVGFQAISLALISVFSDRFNTYIHFNVVVNIMLKLGIVALFLLGGLFVLKVNIKQYFNLKIKI